MLWQVKGRRGGRVEGKGKEEKKGAVQRKRRKKPEKMEGRGGPFCMNQRISPSVPEIWS